jgi:DNA-binding transcriptional LysR family regulator
LIKERALLSATALRRMQPVMGAVNDALDAMNNFRDNPRGILRLSVVRAAAASIIAPLVPAFLNENPEVTLEIVTEIRMPTSLTNGLTPASVQASGLRRT